MRILLLLVLCLSINLSFGQEEKEDKKSFLPILSHTVKLDLTSLGAYSGFVVHYEGQVSKNQSFSVQAGIQQFPLYINFEDVARIEGKTESNGFKIGGDYRFYFKKENKFDAPHGLYWGPYISYLEFNQSINVEGEYDGDAFNGSLDNRLSLTNIGLQLGYQFIIKDHWTIDVGFAGPSLSRYAGGIDLSVNLDPEKLEALKGEVAQEILESFPVIGDFLQEIDLNSQGSFSTWSAGFRYTLSVGYHF